jgi:hypothetical protein
VPTVDELLRVMRDIDALKGRTCGNCHFSTRRNNGGIVCGKGKDPYGPDDGCDDWSEGHENNAA